MKKLTYIYVIVTCGILIFSIYEIVTNVYSKNYKTVIYSVDELEQCKQYSDNLTNTLQSITNQNIVYIGVILFYIFVNILFICYIRRKR